MFGGYDKKKMFSHIAIRQKIAFCLDGLRFPHNYIRHKIAFFWKDLVKKLVCCIFGGYDKKNVFPYSHTSEDRFLFR